MLYTFEDICNNENQKYNLGIFKVLPKDLRIWFFSKLDQRALVKLRMNKSMKEYIDNNVYPYIEKRLEKYVEKNEMYLRLNHKYLICGKCGYLDRHVKGIREKNIYHISIVDNEYQVLLSNTNHTLTDNTDKFTTAAVGICYRCVLIND